ncbi:MAG TPA: Nramp family divalent metal transporter [Planctomycetota bacterium]|nr:Nramp family divalent metal transporter [Planctomycetota bacterium]
MPDDEVVPDAVFPSGALPPLKYGNLPEPIPLRRMIGPSVILLGAAIGSGEFVLWPYIVSHWGFGIWWACMLGLLTQFWVNMEIERYTLATGESTVTGFVRLWKHWAWVFLLCNTIPWAWPGWAMGGATCLSFLVGGKPVIYGVGSMLLIGAVLSLGPVLYKTVERLQLVMVAALLVFILILFVAVVRMDSIAQMASGAVRFGHIPEGIALPFLLGAIAFAGAGGSLNLAQSNYIKDKSYAMGAFIGRITSPITGEVEAIPDTGFLPRATAENARRWKLWWRAANREHFIVFFLLGALSLITLACIAHSTLAGLELKDGMDFIRQEGAVLERAFGSLAKLGLWAAGFLVLFTTELAIMDMVARVTADIVRTAWTRASDTWSLRKIYYICLWSEILVGCGILLAGFREPIPLLVMSACLNGIVMAGYAFILLWLNLRVLPRWLGMGKIRFVAMVWACAFYGYFALIVLGDKIAAFLK